MTRLVLTFALCAFAPASIGSVAFAQSSDWEYRRDEAREARQRAREARRDEQEAAREARRAAPEAARAAGGEWADIRGRNGNGVHLRVLRSYSLPAGSISREPIVVIGGSAAIDGRAEQDVVVIGGTLRIGPRAVILGDAIAVGRGMTVAPGATIQGEIDETVLSPGFNLAWPMVTDGWWAVASFGAMVIRLGMILLVSLLLTWLVPDWTANVGERLANATGSSLVIGLLSQVLFVPALILVTIILIISIVGWPILLAMPLLLLLLALAWTAGFAGVVGRLGARIRGRSGGVSTSPMMDLLAGFAAVTSVTIVAHGLALGPWWLQPVSLPLHLFGWLIEWMVWTVALGAMLTSSLGRRYVPPPLIPIIPQPAPAGS